MFPRPAALLTLILLPALASVGHAEDAADPAAAYAAKVAALPAPAAEDGFRFDGRLRVNGNDIGHATLTAAPDGEAGARWRVRDQVVVKPGARPQIEGAEAVLSRALELLEGGVSSNKPGEAPIAWSKTAKGYRAARTLRRGAVSEEQVRNFEHDGTALTTLAATVLFARQALPEEGTYRTTILEVERGMKGEPALEPVTFEVLGEKELQGKPVLLVRGRKGAQELELVFRPEGRELVAVRLVEGEQRVEILKADRWSLPARDAKAAADRAAFGFATGNVKLLDDVTLWPAYHAAVFQGRPAEGENAAPALETWRKQTLAAWTKRLAKRAPKMIEMGLKMVASQRKVTEREDGTVDVDYPAMFKGMRIRVREAYGFWHFVGMPKVAKPAQDEPEK